MHLCFNCKTPLAKDNFGRRDSCSKCSADTRCCKNCKHYDATAYNECKETNADRVLDKQKSNFCDYFAPALAIAAGTTSTKESNKNPFDDLFKK